MSLSLAQAIDHLWRLKLPEKNNLSSSLSILKRGHFPEHWFLKLPLFIDVELSRFSDNIYSTSKPCFFNQSYFYTFYNQTAYY